MAKKKMYSNLEEKEKAVMVSISVKNEFDPVESLIELEALIEASGIEVVGSLTQKTNEPTVQYLIGMGKLEELKALVDETKPDMVVFDNELSGMRMRNLEDYLDCKVIDRSMLILDIFASRATSAEGKLQVELAQLGYMMPRLSGVVTSSNKYGGGVGMRGPGETKLELDRRRIASQMDRLKVKLKELDKQRNISGGARASGKVKTVAIVGYTNSGKSTLLNTMTKANVLSKDMLFATLDTTSRSLWLGEGKQIVLTDTVGFVSRLPHAFVEAFKSTLKETINADLLYIVVDASSKRAIKELEIVFDVLGEIGAGNKEYILVLNKTDKGNVFSEDDILKHKNVVKISALKNQNIDKLKEITSQILFK